MINKRELLRRSRMVLLLGILFVGCKAVDSHQTDVPKHSSVADVNASTVWGQEVGGFRSRIWSNKARFNTVEPIQIRYAIQNVSKQPKTIWHSGFGTNNRIDVTAPDGTPAVLVNGTPSHRQWPVGIPTLEKSAPFVLQPGGVDDAYVVYNLRDFFDMKTVGVYTVQYVHQDSEEEKPVKSNELKVIVAAPET
jgi:hypothetical protein